MLEVTTFTALVIISTVSIYIYSVFRVGKRKRYPNGPIGVPILGHLPFIGGSPPRTFLRWSQEYGNVFSIKMGSWKTVVVNGYEAVKEAAEKADDVFSSRPEFVTPKMLEDVNGEVSLGFGPFDAVYLQHRKLVATALRYFTYSKSEYTETMIIKETDKLVKDLLRKSGKEPVDIRSDIQYATGSVIYQILYGRVDDLKEQLDKMVKSLNDFIKFTGSGNPCDVMPWLKYVMPWKLSYFKKSVEGGLSIRRKHVDDHVKSVSPGHVRDVTDLLLTMDMQEKSGNHLLTRSRLVGSTADLEGAGFDTSNKSLQWAILYMANYPEVQQRVQKEIDDVVGNGRHVELKDKCRLIYTEATILEIMRMSAIAPFALPKLATKDSVLQGYDIDKGTVVFFNLHSVSYEKSFWGDPQNFRPERLIDINNELITEKCKHIIPFGLGRRRCVGEFFAKMEQFLLFSNVLKRCKFSKIPGVNYDMEPELGIVYSPKPFKVIIEERQ